MVSALIFGLAPLGLLHRSGLHEAIKATARSGGSRSTSRMRQTFVVCEIALAVVLLVGAGLTVRSLWALLSVDTGLKTTGVTAAMLPLPVNRYPTLGQQADAYHQVLERIRQHPGVSAAAVAFPLPFQQKGSTASFNIEGQPATSRANRPSALFNSVSPGYFRALGVPLLRGRDFQESDRDKSPAVAIVTRAFVERFLPGNRDPVGRRLLFGSDPATIVGIAGDFRRDSLDQPPEPMLFMPYRQFSLPFMCVVVRSAAPSATVTALLRQEMRTDRSRPFARAGDDARRGTGQDHGAADIPREGARLVRCPGAPSGVDWCLWAPEPIGRPAHARARRAHGCWRRTRRRVSPGDWRGAAPDGASGWARAS